MWTYFKKYQSKHCIISIIMTWIKLKYYDDIESVIE